MARTISAGPQQDCRPSRRGRTLHAQCPHWLNRDPIGENGGINLYGYVSGNPVNGIDPLGLEPKITFTNGHSVSANSLADFKSIIQNSGDGSIASIRFDNYTAEHGNPDVQVIANPSPFTPAEEISYSEKTGQLWMGDAPWPTTPFTAAFFGNKLAPTANIYFTGCKTASGDKNITQATSEMLKGKYPNVTVTGNQDFTLNYAGLALPDWFNDVLGYRKPRSYIGGKPVGK